MARPIQPASGMTREARDEEERRVVVPCRHEAHRHGHRNRDEQAVERPNLPERVARLHQLILSEGVAGERHQDAARCSAGLRRG